MKKPLLAIFKVVGELLFLFGLLGWIYGILIALVYPSWLTLPLSHLTPDLRQDIFTIYAFVISAIGFVIWRLTKELASSNDSQA